MSAGHTRTTSRTRMTLGAAGAAAAVLVGVSACGSGSSSPSANPGTGAPAHDAAQVFTTAVSHTASQSSAHLSLSEKVSLGDGHTLTTSGTGVENLSTRAFAFTFSVLGHSVQIRQVGGTLYEQLPTGQTGGKPWLGVNLAALEKATGSAGLGQLSQITGSNPTTLLSYLKSVSSGVTAAGTATIRGVPTTRYNATLDLDKALAKLPASARAGAQQLLDRAGGSSVPISVWVDHSGLVRQMQFSFGPTSTASSGSSSSGAMNVSVSSTVQLFDYGSPVSITAPPASQVHLLSAAELSQLAGKATGAGSTTSS